MGFEDISDSQLAVSTQHSDLENLIDSEFHWAVQRQRLRPRQNVEGLNAEC